MKKFSAIFLVLLAYSGAYGQSTNVPLNKDYYHLIDRLEILSGKMAPNHHSAVKAYTRKSVAQMTDSIQTWGVL